MNETFKSLTRKDAESALAKELQRLLPTAPTGQREVSPSLDSTTVLNTPFSYSVEIFQGFIAYIFTAV